MRFNDACQEAAVCRETQLASFCKLLDTHVFLVRDDQLRRCHRGQCSPQTGVRCLLPKSRAPHSNGTGRATRVSCPRRLETLSATRRTQPAGPKWLLVPDAWRRVGTQTQHSDWANQ